MKSLTKSIYLSEKANNFILLSELITD